MKVFKSVEDVEAAGPSPPVHGVIHRIVSGFIELLAKYGGTYDPEDGWTILVEGAGNSADPTPRGLRWGGQKTPEEPRLSPWEPRAPSTPIGGHDLEFSADLIQR